MSFFVGALALSGALSDKGSGIAGMGKRKALQASGQVKGTREKMTRGRIDSLLWSLLGERGERKGGGNGIPRFLCWAVGWAARAGKD